MRFDSRYLIIGVMFLIIIALMVLVYRVNTLVVDHIPRRIEPEVYVAGLTEAAERQNRVCVDLAYQANWLRRHLEKCLTLIESQRGLEPMSLKSDMSKGPFAVSPRFSSEASGPFITPYEKHDWSGEDSPSEEKDIRRLTCLTNLATLSAQMSSIYDMDRVIENFQQRLERIAPDPNGL